jgi:hypothetical protein
MGVFARQAQATVIDAWLSVSLTMKRSTFSALTAEYGGERLLEAVQGDDGIPVLVRRFQRLRHQRHLPGDVEQAGKVLGPLDIAGHPEQGGRRYGIA